jgi:hypothetical protein
MRHLRLVLMLGLWVIMLSSSASAAADTSVLIEAESFQFKGAWLARPGGSGGTFIAYEDRADPAKGTASTVIELPAEGRYTIWCRVMTPYLESNAKSPRFSIVIDGKAFSTLTDAPTTLPDHNYVWVNFGAADLAAGQHMLQLHAAKPNWSKADAVLITTEPGNPNTWDESKLKKVKAAPLTVNVNSSVDNSSPLNVGELEEVATLENDRLKITYLRGKAKDGTTVFGRSISVRSDNDEWEPLPIAPFGDQLFIITSDTAELKFSEGAPRWPDFVRQGQLTIRGQDYTVGLNETDPFGVGRLEVLRPILVEQRSAYSVAMTYRSESGQQATVLWSLQPGRWDVQAKAKWLSRNTGYVSLGYLGFQPFRDEQVQAVQLPPLFQFKRWPSSAQMVTTSLTPHPAAMVQVADAADQSITLAVVAEPSKLTQDWPSARNADYGFSITNSAGNVQPTLFSPVLGMTDSETNSGKRHEVEFRLLIRPGQWTRALEYMSDEIMDLQDYRKPVGASLTQAALNLMSLIKDDDAGGWDDELKGFYNIEMDSTVTQASPLTLVSAAILANDEQMYLTRVLPTIEYTLTRPDPHFARPGENDRFAPAALKVPTNFYTTAYWQGLHDLLGQRNPWMVDLALPDGEITHNQTYLKSPRLSNLLAKYRLTGDQDLLDQICQQADTYIDQSFNRDIETPLDYSKFYHISFYPYWNDLVDLYEITGEERYLDAAVEGAFFTTAGHWSFPQVPSGNQTIYKNDRLMGERLLLHKGGEIFRLGYDPSMGVDNTAWRAQVPYWPMKERQVPAWQVARTGMTFEQPSTYFSRNKESAMRHIFMSTTGPALLRLAHLADEPLFRTYARNSVIGRFANYPGYYYSAYSTVALNPDYPYQGPDATAVYYHHIPVHLAFVLEYLIAQAEDRTHGQIHFPYVKQQGYAWFSNRIYGQTGGEVYGQPSQQPRIAPGLVKTDTIDIDWLVAQSDQSISVILMSQSREELHLQPELDFKALGVNPAAKASVFLGAQDQAVAHDWSPGQPLLIPPMGCVTLRFPRANLNATPPVNKDAITPTHRVVELDKPWGQLHAFRIRSPFGFDSLYLAITGNAKSTGQARFTINDREVTVSRFPYEYSLPSVDQDKAVDITVHLQAGDASKQVTLTGL